MDHLVCVSLRRFEVCCLGSVPPARRLLGPGMSIRRERWPRLKHRLHLRSSPTLVFSAQRLPPSISTGKERDTESGNDYFGARYYASTMGRFLTPDWASNPEAVPYGIYTNPQTLNLYNYMRNNPLSGTDKDGHCGGPNDPCSQVKVTTEQKDPSTGKPTSPQIVQNEKQPDGLVRSGVRAIVTDTITVGGKALPDKTLVSESNENTLTVNGKKIDAQTAQSPPTPTTDGKVGDVFGPLKSTAEPGSSQSFANALSGNAVTMTGKQTLTFDIPSGATCSATIGRTLSNGSGGSTYTYTTTSGPTVTQAQPQPPQ